MPKRIMGVPPDADVSRRSVAFRDDFKPGPDGPGGFPHLEDAGKFDALEVVRLHALEAAHQQPPGGGGEVLDRLGDGGQIRPQRKHPVEVVEADDRQVAGDFEIEPARRLDRGERADIGEGEDRRRPVGAMKLELDCAAQRFEVMAAVDDALAPLKPAFGQGATGAGDAAARYSRAASNG